MAQASGIVLVSLAKQHDPTSCCFFCCLAGYAGVQYKKMRILIETYSQSKQLHHSYCIEGERQATIGALTSFLEQDVNISRQGNPDYWHAEFETFGIEESRTLKERQMGKSLSGGKKVFVVAFDFITIEAQNALLKVLEEPSEGTHIFLIVPTAEILLPTVRSRLFTVRHAEKERDQTQVKKFLGARRPERLEMIKRFVDDKDKSGTLRFLEQLEVECARALTSKEGAQACETVLAMKGYMYDRSASVKMILEHLATVLPRISKT